MIHHRSTAEADVLSWLQELERLKEKVKGLTEGNIAPIAPRRGFCPHRHRYKKDGTLKCRSCTGGAA